MSRTLTNRNSQHPGVFPGSRLNHLITKKNYFTLLFPNNRMPDLLRSPSRENGWAVRFMMITLGKIMKISPDIQLTMVVVRRVAQFFALALNVVKL